MILRDYQSDTVAAVGREYDQGVESTLAVLPTGTGKTVVFSAIARAWSQGRALVIAPTIELVDQAALKLADVTGEEVAVEQAGRTSCEIEGYRAPYVVATRATLLSKRGGVERFKRFEDIGLVIVDEADTSATSKSAELLQHYRERGAKILGVTATPQRADGVSLGTIFDSVAYKMFIPEAIDRGWLVAPRALCCQLETLDLSEVKVTRNGRGDFREKDLAAVMEQEKTIFEIAEIVARESVEEGRTLRTAVYCATVAEARAVAERLRDHHQIAADWVCGDQRLCPPQRRRAVLDNFADPEYPLTHVCNVGVLTTGWDCPNLEHLVTARPTKSLRLYTQILGRGTRPLPGVVDFADSTPETRRQAIAASAKPTFKVTDLADNTLSHRLAGVADVLAGTQELPRPGHKKTPEDRVGEEVRRQMARGEAIDIRAAIEKAQEREKKRQEELERRRLARQQVASQAKYQRRDVDLRNDPGGLPILTRRREAVMPFGKHKDTPLSKLPSSYIHSVLAIHESPKHGMRLGRQLEYLLRSQLATRKQEKEQQPKRSNRRAAPQQPAERPPATPTYTSLADRLRAEFEAAGMEGVS